jgi:phage protein D
MSKVTNLNQVRKQKVRADKRAEADANAAKFGRTKAQKALEQAEADKARRELDRHRKDD